MSLYENIHKEIKILKHASKNNYDVASQLVTESKIFFSVDEKHLPPMKKFCQDNFGECEIIEQRGSKILCKVG